MDPQFSLRRAQIFAAVVQHSGVSNAATHLGLAQSTVSSHLAQLEHDLGAVLLHRSSRVIRLTDAGAVFLEYARTLLAVSAEAADKIARMANAPVAGILTIGSTSTVTARILPRLLSEFVDRYPAVEIDLHVHNTNEIMQRVADGRLPFALTAGSCDVPGIEAVQVTTEAQVVITAGNHPLAGQRVPPRVLHGSRILLREEGSTTRRNQLELMELWQLPGAHVSTIASTSAIIGAVALGFGISCLPRTTAEDALLLGRVSEIYLDPSPPFRPIHLIRPSDRQLNRTEALFLDIAREEGIS